MKKSIAIGFLLTVFLNFTYGQELTQTVRGTVLDVDSRLPLIGGTIIVIDSDPFIGAATDVNGRFKLVNVPVGRITLKISSIGYQEIIIPNIVVNSGKEVVLNLDMQESLEMMDEFVVKAYQNKGEAINDMTLISARSISPEETNRYAGGFNDPSRITANFAGVTNTQDGSNDIIVRGNSPKYIQWRLEGVEISNPNHFADQNSISGGVSALNNNLLTTSDFSTGAFSPEYGNVLSGVYDVKLRAGNNEKFESTFGFGLLGTDLTLEGPFKKGYGGSFLINYRYSTITLIEDLNLIDINGDLKFQDATIKIVLPTKKMGTFSLFALGGLSNFLLKDITPEFFETPGNNNMKTGISEDFDKKSHLLNAGVNHVFSINNNSFIKTNLSYSSDVVKDDIFEMRSIQIFDGQGTFLRDSTVSRYLNFKSNLNKSAYRAGMVYNNKINAKNKIQLGAKYTLFSYTNGNSKLRDNLVDRVELVNFKEDIGIVNNFISWKYRFNEKLTFVSGLHNMNVLYNQKSTLEPSFALNWKLNNTNSLNFGYGNHSKMESVHHYFTKIELANGTTIEPNKELDLLKAHHYVLGYEKRFNSNVMAKVEVYYQDLYNLPVENNDSSYFATINESLDYRFVDLVNEGTGKNYGIEFTLERFFNNNYY
ncbi:MAG: TonB-dependent receptor [Flavobacteriales bacterium]|nr:TonB-dependent receptor [Flavobacteriales bacterium]